MTWVKGTSGNPGGRPRLVAGLRRLAQNDSEEAYQAILAVMRDSDKGSERLAAAVKVLQIAGVPMTAEVTVTVNDSPVPLDLPDVELESIVGNAQGKLQ